MIEGLVDWGQPIMLKDFPGKVITLHSSPRSDTRRVEVLGHNRFSNLAEFTVDGRHIRYQGETHLGRIVNRPEIDWDAPLKLLDGGKRVKFLNAVITGEGTAYEVEAPDGEILRYHIDGRPIRHDRGLRNYTFAELKAEATEKIREAQSERRARREQDALASSPMWGMF